MTRLILLALLLTGCALENDQNRPAQGLVPPPGTVPVERPGSRPPLTRALLWRGQELFTVNCVPCHAADGAGRGEVVRRGFQQPPDLTTVPPDDAYIWSVVTNGAGSMFPYRDRISPSDRWAVAAYVRALQLSRKPVKLDDLPPELRAQAEREL